MATNKKRNVDQLDDNDDLMQENIRLTQENLELRVKLAECEKTIANYKNQQVMSEDDEDEDEESVCDGSGFSKNYHLLKQYKQENGDCKVPYQKKGLGCWVNNTRASYKKNKLSQANIDKVSLDSNVFGPNAGLIFPHNLVLLHLPFS